MKTKDFVLDLEPDAPAPPPSGWNKKGNIKGAAGGGTPPPKDVAGVTKLIFGQNYIDVVFPAPLAAVGWSFIECRIVNTEDIAPPNIYAGVVTQKSENGFRLLLSQAPNTNNYWLNWVVRPAVSTVGTATTYLMTGPSTGNLGKPATFLVQVPAGQTLAAPVTITPSDGASGSGGIFSPASVTLTNTTPNAAFTYTPNSYGTKTISATNDKGLTDPPNLAFNVVSPNYFLNGASNSGTAGTPTGDYTVALPSGAVVPDGGVVITSHVTDPSGNSSLGTPPKVTLSNDVRSATFKFTPASAGAYTVSTTNNGAMVDPAPLTYNAT